MHSFEVHSNKSACRKKVRLGLEQVLYIRTVVWKYWAVFLCADFNCMDMLKAYMCLMALTHVVYIKKFTPQMDIGISRLELFFDMKNDSIKYLTIVRQITRVLT